MIFTLGDFFWSCNYPQPYGLFNHWSVAWDTRPERSKGSKDRQHEVWSRRDPKLLAIIIILHTEGSDRKYPQTMTKTEEFAS